MNARKDSTKEQKCVQYSYMTVVLLSTHTLHELEKQKEFRYVSSVLSLYPCVVILTHRSGTKEVFDTLYFCTAILNRGTGK